MVATPAESNDVSDSGLEKFVKENFIALGTAIGIMIIGLIIAIILVIRHMKNAQQVPPVKFKKTLQNSSKAQQVPPAFEETLQSSNGGLPAQEHTQPAKEPTKIQLRNIEENASEFVQTNLQTLLEQTKVLIKEWSLGNRSEIGCFSKNFAGNILGRMREDSLDEDGKIVKEDVDLIEKLAITAYSEDKGFFLERPVDADSDQMTRCELILRIFFDEVRRAYETKMLMDQYAKSAPVANFYQNVDRSAYNLDAMQNDFFIRFSALNKDLGDLNIGSLDAQKRKLIGSCVSDFAYHLAAYDVFCNSDNASQVNACVDACLDFESSLYERKDETKNLSTLIACLKTLPYTQQIDESIHGDHYYFKSENSAHI